MRRRARRYTSNNNQAFIPELWSMYTVAILEKHMVMGKLVFRDFENEVKMFGDTVNTRKPAPFSWDRKTDSDQISYQDATATNIAVLLNMHPYVSFIIKDGEQSLSMEKLVERYLDGAVKSMAQGIDACVAGQWPQFLGLTNPTIGGSPGAGSGGTLGGLSESNYQTALAQTVLALDNANCPVDGRNVVVCPRTKSLLLQNQPVIAAYARGDGGTALETADMGMIYGVQHYMSQSFFSIGTTDIASSTFVVNHAAGYEVGTTTMTIGTGTGALAIGQWFTLDGRPYRITAHTETLGNTTSINIDPPLSIAASNGDALTVYGGGAVNNVAGYALGWAKGIVYDNFTNDPKVGQGVSFGTSTGAPIYTIVQVNTTSKTVWLDRALEETGGIADDAVMNLLPPGDYNLAFRRDAIALICRPLEAPRLGAGAISVNVTHAGYPLRIVIAYDHANQGHAVTIDCLMGVKTIDPNQGAVLLG